MKATHLLTLTLFLVLNGLAQPAPKKANAIKASTEKTAINNFNNCVAMLNANAYVLNQTNKTAFTITTAPQKLKGLNVYVTFNLVCLNGFIRITGTYNIPGLDNEQTPIANRGGNGSATKRAFLEMDKMAKLLSHNLTYTIN